MKIAIAADHAGYELKQKLIMFLGKKGYEVIDLGTTNKNSADFPDYAFKVGKYVTEKDATFGILVCGTGIGMTIACNKVKRIRCAHICDKKDAIQSREHLDANVIAIRGNMTLLTAEEIISTFLTTPFLNLPRYKRRKNKIAQYEDRHER